MRTICIVLSVIIATGCSEALHEEQPTLYGNWMYAKADGTQGTGVEFRNDGTYSQFNLALTSETSAYAELETGTFALNGSAITVTPQQATCPGPSPVLTLQHSFRGSNVLILSLPSGAISLERNTTSASEAFVIVYGCFDRKNGTFNRASLAPISN